MAELRLKQTGTIQLFENDNTSKITIASPASLGADRTITLPDADVTLASGTMLAADGSGASLTALNASELGSGTVPDARFPATLPAASATNLTAVNATQITSGTIPDDARLPTVGVDKGGTNLTSFATGDIIYASGTTAISKLAKPGTPAGEVLTFAACASAPSWAAAASGISWQSVQTSTPFTAVAGNGYPINTTSGAITMNLPAGVVGEQVAVVDYAGTFDTNALTIAANGSENIKGSNLDVKMQTERQAGVLTYVDATQGWVLTSAAPDPGIAPDPLFVTATGGTITTVGDYKIHTFTGDGTFAVSCAGNSAGNNIVDYLTVAGGGGGGYSCHGHQGSGGGAGGYRESVPSPAAWTASPLASPAGGLTVSATPYSISVGGGGAASGAPDTVATSGSQAVFSSITSAGGGGGGAGSNPGPARQGLNGGSGGGSASSDQPALPGCSGNTPPVSPSQGNPGGIGGSGSGFGASGGGAKCAGANRGSPPSPYFPGGAGTPSSFTDSAVTYGTGGGSSPTSGGFPSLTANRGEGGAGGPATSGSDGQAGSSGVVILRYKFQ